MIRNYLTVSIRNLFQNKNYFFINVVGLGLALSTCIVAYLNSEFALNFDGQHKNAEKIYKVQIRKEAEGRFTNYGINPLPLGPAALNDISHIRQQARYINPDYVVQKGDVVLYKEIGFADENFLKMFSYPLKVGDAEGFANKNNIFLSAEMAEVYFGDQDPVGEILTVRNDDDEDFPFIVAGVFEKIPLNSSIYFDALTIIDNYFDIAKVDRNSWRSFVGATFFVIETPDQARIVEDLLSQYVEVQNNARDDWKVAEYYMFNLNEYVSNSRNILANWLNEGMHPAAAMAPPVMAILILLIACFNFTNTSIALASSRLKEIGIRKVMGGGKRQLIVQFMSENLLVCLFAIILSLAIANYIVPAYAAMWPDVDLSLEFTSNFRIYLFLFGLLIITALLAGAYPSVYISSFEPVNILRGSIQLGGSSKFSKILLSVQFIFTTMALFAGIAFIQNAKYQETLDMGFNRETIVGAMVENHSDYLKLKDAFMSNPDVVAVAGTDNHIGQWDYTRTLRDEDREIESFMLDFGPGYIEAMELRMVEGRTFSEELKQSDMINSLIVNEKLVETFGWDEPIGKRVSIDDSTTLSVIGVVKDFHQNGFWKEVEPFGMRLAKEEDFNFIIAKVPASKVSDTHNYLEEKWRQLIPIKPFTGFYQDELESIRQAKLVNNNIAIIFGFLAVISVVLSVIGLFTLVSLNIIRRTKEIGIRKVLGAPIPNLITMMNKPFIFMIAIGGSLGLVFGFFIVDMLISSVFDYYKKVDLTTFLVPIVLILVISLLTSSSRILNAALRNPVESLRYE